MSEKKHSVFSALANVGGLSKDALREIASNVAKNFEALNACPRHEFVSTCEGNPLADYVCARCGGTVDCVAYSWYTRGLEHGRRAAIGAEGEE